MKFALNLLVEILWGNVVQMEVEEVENSFFMCITKDHLSEAVPEGQIYAVNRTTLMIRFGLDKGNDFSLNSWRHLSPAEKAGEQFLEEASLVAGAVMFMASALDLNFLKCQQN